MNLCSHAADSGHAMGQTFRAPRTLSFPQKLIAAFALAIGIPLFGYAALMTAINEARMKEMDEAALEQRTEIAEQHVWSAGLNLLRTVTSAASHPHRYLGTGDSPDATRPHRLLEELNATHALAAACILYADGEERPEILGEDLPLDALIGDSGYARSALRGKAVWGIMAHGDSLALVGAAPMAAPLGSGKGPSALVIATEFGEERLRRLAGTGECGVVLRQLQPSEAAEYPALAGSLNTGREDSGFERIHLGTSIEDSCLCASAILRGLVGGASPTLMTVTMARSALPGRGPRFVTVALCAFACALLLAALLTSLVTQWVAHPLDDLRARSEAIAQGQRLKEPMPVTTNDALGRVAAAFNYMVANLEDAQSRVLHNERLAMAGKMAAAVAHEVRNVLAPIHIRADVLLQGVTDPVARENLEGMRDEVSRGAALLRSLLEFARSGSTEFRPVAVSDVVERAAELVAPQLSRAGTKLSVQGEPYEATVWGDQAQILQLMVNLLNNAGDAGARHVTAAVEVVGDSVRLVVRDDGTGMDEETRRRALEPFFTTKPSGAGTGLGLSVCHSVVESHGGTISIESQRHEGTRIIVSLPVFRES